MISLLGSSLDRKAESLSLVCEEICVSCRSSTHAMIFRQFDRVLILDTRTREEAPWVRFEVIVGEHAIIRGVLAGITPEFFGVDHDLLMRLGVEGTAWV